MPGVLRRLCQTTNEQQLATNTKDNNLNQNRLLFTMSVRDHASSVTNVYGPSPHYARTENDL